MRGRPGDAREYVIIGHQLEVFRTSEGTWSIAVDQEVLRSCFAHPYAAWAAGVAESYRQGRCARPPPVMD